MFAIQIPTVFRSLLYIKLLFLQIHTIDGEDIRREKGTYTREKNNLFLKNMVELGKDGNFGVKESVLEKLKVEEIKFLDIFAGPEPVFEVTKRAKSAGQNVNFVAKKKIEGKSHQVLCLFNNFDLSAFWHKLLIIKTIYSGDLNSELVRYSNGPKQFAP